MTRQDAGLAGEILVTTLDQIPVGEGRTFSLADGEIAIFHLHDGSVHATQAYCPHLGGPLADGLTSESAVMCPLHDRTFDLVSGCGLTHEHMTIKVFTSRLDGEGNVWVVPGAVPERVPVRIGADAHRFAAAESMEIVGSS